LTSLANICVCVSGGGRSLQNLINYQSHSKNWKVACVVSSSKSCAANEMAKSQGLELFIGDFSKKGLAATSDDLLVFLKQNAIDWIVLAGFLKLFPVFEDYQKRTINIHPALLPEFGGPGMYGHFVHEAVLKSGVHQSGASVHFVNDRYDDGAMISQIKTPISGMSTVNDIAKAVFQGECRLLPTTIDRLVSGELPLPKGAIWELK
jgi:phosphoribosylglycinamide formyltransferase-1